MAGGGGPEADDRTEAPTQRRLDRARGEGNVPLSREVLGFVGLLAATIAGMIALPPLAAAWLHLLRGVLQAPDPGSAAAAVGVLVRGTLHGVLPVLLAVAAAGVLASFLQVGPLLRPEALAPDLGRLNPMAALGRIFGVQGLVELLRTLVKLGIVGGALWFSVEPATLQAALHLPAGALFAALGREVLHLLAVTLVAYGAIAVLDILWVRWRRLQDLRMSRQDLRDEARDSEGDPQVKARLRRLREQRARQRMLAAVPKAAVVITNPTHFAVALGYEQGQSAAPRLLAKGADEMAARIRAVAAEHGVPIVENPPLARALFQLEPDSEIPVEHWQAVAEIIAYVWGLRRHG